MIVINLLHLKMLIVFYLAFCYISVQAIGTNVINGSSWYSRLSRTDARHTHEVLIAVKQNGKAKLEKEILFRTSLNSSTFQKWLTYEEVIYNVIVMLQIKCFL